MLPIALNSSVCSVLTYKWLTVVAATVNSWKLLVAARLTQSCT